MHNCQLHKNRERLVVQHKVTFESLLFHSSPFATDVDDLFVRLQRTLCLSHVIAASTLNCVVAIIVIIVIIQDVTVDSLLRVYTFKCKTSFTRYNLLSKRLSKRFDNRLLNCTAGWTTGCIL